MGGLAPTPPAHVAAALDSGSAAQRLGKARLREAVLSRAQELPGVGRIKEDLRWGQLAFLTPETKAGSSLRIADKGDGFALFVHCQTDLIARLRAIYGDTVTTEKSRALVFQDAEFDTEPACLLAGWALTYHL